MENWITEIMIILGVLGAAIIIWALWADRNIIYTDRIERDKKYLDGKNGILSVYCLPETVLEIELKIMVMVSFEGNNKLSQVKIIERNFVTKTSLQADVSSTYAVRYKVHHLSNDEIGVSVNEHNMLESLNVVADDQSSAIVSAVVSAPATVLADKTAQRGMFPGAQKESRIEIREYSKGFKFDAWASVTEPQAASWNFTVYSEDHKSNKPVDASFTLRAEVQGTKSTDDKARSVSVPEGEVTGLLFRTKTPASVLIKNIADETEVKLPGLIFIDKSFVFSVPIRRNPFVKRKHDLVIKSGVLISHVLVKPSSVLGFIGIPIAFAKAIVSIPAQLISFRIDTVTRKRDLEAMKNNLTEEVIKNKEQGKKLEQLRKEEDKARELELLSKKNHLEVERKVQQLQASLAQSRIDRALDAQSFEKRIKELEDQNNSRKL
jgi:hypothetical protein